MKMRLIFHKFVIIMDKDLIKKAKEKKKKAVDSGKIVTKKQVNEKTEFRD